MSKITDIQQKYLRLIEIYADKNLDNNGAEAQNLIGELIAKDAGTYKTEIDLFKRSLKPTQKFFANSVDRSVSTARKNATQNVDAAPRVAPAQPTPTAPQATKPVPVAPSPDDNTPSDLTSLQNSISDAQRETLVQYALIASKAGIDLNKISRDDYEMSLLILEEEYKMSAQHDAEEFILNADADDYSDTLGDYMDAEGLPPAQKNARLSGVLDVIEMAANDKNLDLYNAVALAATVAQTSNDHAVVSKALSAIAKVDEVASANYVKQIKTAKEFPKDSILYAIYNPKIDENEDFIHTAITRHIRGVLNKLDAEQAAKYTDYIEQQKFGMFLPLAKAEPLRAVPEANRPTEAGPRTKDLPNTPIPDEVLHKLTSRQRIELNKYRYIAQLTGADLAAVTAENYKEMLAALKAAKKNFWISFDKPDTQGDRKMTDLTDRQKEMLEAMKKRFADNNMEVPEGKISRETFQIYYDNLERIMDKHSAPDTAKGGDDKDQPKFTLTKAQLWAADKAGIDWKKCASVEEVMGKINDAGYIVDGDKVLIKDGSEDGKLVAEYDKDKDKMVEKEAGEKKDKELKVGVINETPVPQEEKQPEKPLDWVQKKIDDYTAMSAAGKIADFTYDKENKTEFVASFDGATIHYSSPDNVNVSENAGIKVFETILNEPDNQNRTINFADNMPHDTAIHLKAACLLNGRAMTGAQPEFTEADLQKLSQELGPERFKQLNDALHPEREAEKPAKEEKAPVISSVEELGQAAESIRGIKEKFNKMKEDGLIAVTTNLETKKPEIVAGPALSGKSEEEQKKAVADANALITDAAEIVMASKTLSGKLNEAQQKDNNTFNEERLEHIRNGMNQQQLAEHDSLSPEDRAEKVKKLREDISIKLGITKDPSGERKALEGKELADYISESKITVKNYAELWQEANKGKKFDIKELGDADKSVFMQISKAQLDRRNLLLGKSRSNER